jgi:tetrapyrrole methylase family protein / MazG family protein
MFDEENTAMAFALDPVFAALGVDPLGDGVQVIAATALQPEQPFAPLLPFVTTRPLLICGLGRDSLKRVQSVLLAAYPSGHPARLVTGQDVESTSLAALDQATPAAGMCAYLPAQPVLDAVDSFDALQEITARLRAPDGCPWDRQQTHESLKPFVLEETYEVLEALDSGDRAELCEELGDLMMQVMIHSQVAAEAGEFDVHDVLAGISSKLIRRHPHVFGNVEVSGAQDVLRNWQSIKQGEKKTNGGEPPPSLLGGVPVQLPALAYTQAMQERAGRVGFMRPDGGVVERIGGLLESISAPGTHEQKLAAYGDLLFALVQIGRWLGVEAEEALRMASGRARTRFVAAEALCRQRGLNMHDLTDDQREAVWQEAAD